MTEKKILCLFDVDGTLTKFRNIIEPKMYSFLMEKVKHRCRIGLVGGSDFKKISEQMNGDDVINKFDYVFPENGLIQFKHGKEIGRTSILKFMGEEKLQTFINFSLKYLSTISLPVKRGNFIEFRTGLINVSPVGRSCSQEERDAFEIYDQEHHIRETMIEALRKEFPPEFGLSFSVGGQISIDVFPHGWDKTFCLQHVENDGHDEIHFFGDRTDKGGNDHEIYIDKRVIGHKVTGPLDTKKQLEELLDL